MHALFFEMTPKPGHLDHYFDHVARLQPALSRHSGLVFLNRYGARGRDDLLLSHQLWESEADIAAWRRDSDHRRSQAAGYSTHFADYRIRVGRRIRYHTADGEAVPPGESPLADPRYLLAAYGTTPPADPAFALFDSFKREGQSVALADFGDLALAEDRFVAVAGQAGVQEVALYAVLRDYGRFDRAQAPR